MSRNPRQKGKSKQWWADAQRWFDPREGLATMRAPLDYLVMAALGAGSFVLSFVGYWWLPMKIFDENYFATAGEEYLRNVRLTENTHPPLSKLLIATSMMLFGGLPHGHGLGGWTGLNAIVGRMSDGDNPYGWRFFDVIFGALVVMLLYVFAKRVTGSTLFAAVAALLLTLDGMHFVQSRIATPEGFVVFFATLAVYAFYRFWIGSQVGERAHVNVPAWGFAVGCAASLLVGLVAGLICSALGDLNTAASVLVALYAAGGFYLIVRYVLFAKLFGDGRRELSYAEGSYALREDRETTLFAADGGSIDSGGKILRGATSQAKGGMLVYRDDPLTIQYARDGSVAYETPTGGVTYVDDEIRDRATPAVERGRASGLWLMLFAVALGLLIGTKWYGVMTFGAGFVVLIALWLQRYFVRARPALWGNPRGVRLDGALVAILFVSATVYALAWLPDLLRNPPDEVYNVNRVVLHQYAMYKYHATLTATHPYASKWWEWPLDYSPFVYWWFARFQKPLQGPPNASSGCCVYEIIALPNPMVLWFGLFCVPFVAVLAWRERNKAYALVAIAYLLQWLPWMKSPRITFVYHFYVDIPLVCLCNAIVLQRLWEWCGRHENRRWIGGLALGGYLAVVAAAFAYFYPILAASPLTWSAWHQRMWFPTWIIGPS